MAQIAPVSQQFDQDLASDIQDYLADHPELRRDDHEHPLGGHCFVASEVYHVLSDHETTPYQMEHEGSSHWFLRNSDGDVIDLTADQFETTPPYNVARGRGFGTRNGPSDRAQQVIEGIRQ